MSFANICSHAVRRFFVLLIVSSGLAADSPPGNAPVPTDPVFQARLADGSTASGRIHRLGPDGNLVLVGEQERSFPLLDLVSLVRDGDIPPSYPDGSLVVFPEGDRLRAIINTADETSLEVQPGALGDRPTRIALNAMLGVVLSPPSDPKSLAGLLANITGEARDSDVLWLGNGDRLTGDLVGLGSEIVSFRSGAKVLELPRPGVLAIGFDPQSVRYPRPDGLFLELTFTDGSRLGASALSLEQGTLTGSARFGGAIRPSIETISRIYVRGGKVRYLSEIAAAGSQFVGYLGEHPGRIGRNTTWDGFPLRLAHLPFDRGLGMLPRTLVAYKLTGEDHAFQATIGLDDRAGERGSVVFRVMADGKDKYVSPPLTKRDRPEFVNVDLTGVKLLILVVEFAEGGDVQDSADWIDARLVR
jgi:hypothetical protein